MRAHILQYRQRHCEVLEACVEYKHCHLRRTPAQQVLGGVVNVAIIRSQLSQMSIVLSLTAITGSVNQVTLSEFGGTYHMVY